MKFLVDAQLPRRLAHRLQALGHDVVHTLDLPQGNRTPDALINQRSMTEQRVVVTKDVDFVDALIVRGQPYKLLLVSTGNIDNNTLERLFVANMSAIVAGFASNDFIEIDRTVLRFHF